MSKKGSGFQYHLKRLPLLNSLYVGLAIILFWRGIWGITDQYLFPDNPLLSYAASIAAGLGLLYLNDFHLTEIE